MAENDGSTGAGRLTREHPPAWRLGVVGPLLLGLGLGTLAAGYLFWSHGQAQHAAETIGDPGLPKPAAVECAIVRSLMTSAHSGGDDARWTASVAAKAMTLKAHSLVVNPSDIQGYSDDEADDARGKPQADWRACPGMADFVRGLRWTPLSADIDSAELSLARPGLNKSGDEAKVYEAFSGPTPDDPDARRLTRGPWLVTLRRSSGGAWAVADRTEAPKSH